MASPAEEVNRLFRIAFSSAIVQSAEKWEARGRLLHPTNSRRTLDALALAADRGIGLLRGMGPKSARNAGTTLVITSL
jgi:hypothetical protein